MGSGISAMTLRIFVAIEIVLEWTIADRNQRGIVAL